MTGSKAPNRDLYRGGQPCGPLRSSLELELPVLNSTLAHLTSFSRVWLFPLFCFEDGHATQAPCPVHCGFPVVELAQPVMQLWQCPLSSDVVFSLPSAHKSPQYPACHPSSHLCMSC